jgi:molybdate transport system ATP-binding protein
LSGIGVRLERVSLELSGTRVLKDIRLELPPGAKRLLVGANGAGKSQLMKLIAGERWPAPTGRELREYRDGRGRLELAEVLKKVQLVSAERQDKYLRYEWGHSVTQVIATGCMASDIPRRRLNPAERRRVSGLLKRFGLWRLRRRSILTLSYGERRLVLLARALAGAPRLLLLDEPYNGLDQAFRRRLDGLLTVLTRAPLTLVLSAHRAEDAPAVLRHVILLGGGRIRHDGPRRRLPGRSLAAPPRVRARRAPKAAGEPLVEVEGVSLYRDYRAVLKGLTFSIRAGEHWAVLGANGSGKSSVLRFLLGELPAAAGGRIRRRGHERGTPMELWRRRMGFVSPELQAEYLAPVTLLDLVVSGTRASIGLLHPASAHEQGAARAALARVGLRVDPSRSPRALSYGQMRLALMARALCGRPEALFLDEPLTGLDAAARARILALLARLADDGLQIVIAAHRRGDIPPCIDHVLELKAGRARLRRSG